VEHAERIEAVARELEALTAAVAAGPMSAQVPTCPEWTMADLATHVGQFCGFWTHILCEGGGRDKPPFPEPPESSELRDWLAAVGHHLLEQLRTTPAETRVWTWYPSDQSAGFVARRCAHELAVHRYDAQSARGTRSPIDRALAVDGIDEIFEALVTARARSGLAQGQTIHLHGTDDDVDNVRRAEWSVTLHPDRIEVAHTHAKGDLALRGATSDLELVLYGRPSLGPVERFGDEAVLDAWYREFSF
jgi:uncharacterized protein (TIGR03083 family)